MTSEHYQVHRRMRQKHSEQRMSRGKNENLSEGQHKTAIVVTEELVRLEVSTDDLLFRFRLILLLCGGMWRVYSNRRLLDVVKVLLIRCCCCC